jgi:FdhD protein
VPGVEYRMESLDAGVHSDGQVVASERGATESRAVRRWQGESSSDDYDLLAVEEPLQVRMAGEDVAVTMRTPGHDVELAAGFLFTEGLIGGLRHVGYIGYCAADDGSTSANVVNLQPTERGLVDPHMWGRDFLSSSSCGLCGKTSIDQIKRRTGRITSDLTVSASTIYALPDKLRAAQAAFSQTGGIHAAALFDSSGNLLVMREDVGRHNAVDKAIGHALLNDMLPLRDHILLVSSRASFEIVQKAAMAGVPVLAAISAPSTLAVEMAREAGMTLVAFLRGGRMNVYAGEWRIQVTGPMTADDAAR